MNPGHHALRQPRRQQRKRNQDDQPDQIGRQAQAGQVLDRSPLLRLHHRLPVHLSAVEGDAQAEGGGDPEEHADNDAKRETELYKKFKEMKEKLQALYKELQVQPKEIRADEQDQP